MKIGDIIIARYSVKGLESDAGDEATINVIAELRDYTIGIGCIDADALG